MTILVLGHAVSRPCALHLTALFFPRFCRNLLFGAAALRIPAGEDPIFRLSIGSVPATAIRSPTDCAASTCVETHGDPSEEGAITPYLVGS